MATDYSRLIPAPARSDINTGFTSPPNSLLLSLLGTPELPLSQDDQPERASPKVRNLVKAIKIRGRHYEGIGPFVDLVGRVLDRAKNTQPELFAALGADGILVVRYQRGSMTKISNHSWGTAIDFEFLNPATGQMELDLPQGNGKVQVGCLELYKLFKAEGTDSDEHCYWGAGFSGGREDGMHFEASSELLAKWQAEGRI